MTINLDPLIHIFCNQVFPFAIIFLDDLLLFLLSHLGINLPGLPWLSHFLIALTAISWIIRGLQLLATYKYLKLKKT
jgi:hypothetical protein